jgi:hypothetical protein
MRKDNAAVRWCENASMLTNIPWRYLKVPQKAYEALRTFQFRGAFGTATRILVFFISQIRWTADR